MSGTGWLVIMSVIAGYILHAVAGPFVAMTYSHWKGIGYEKYQQYQDWLEKLNQRRKVRRQEKELRKLLSGNPADVMSGFSEPRVGGTE